MGQFSKKWEELTFTDNFIFCKVMQDEQLCKRMIEILLGIKIKKIKYLVTENQIENYYDSRGIRLDVYVKDSNRVFDLEMQTGDYDELLLRARYYQSASDVATVKRRTKFKDLKETFIIFLCKDDPFGAGIPVYTKKLSFAETDKVPYDDKTHNVFYNSSAWEKVQDKEIRDVLRFIYESRTDSDYTKALDTSSQEAKARSEWEDEYMYFQDILEEEKEIAHDSGVAEGISQGITQGAHDAKLETARNLLNMAVLTTEQIAQGTGLSLEEVEQIKEAAAN